ncbi:MAG: hypothetical protein IAF94_23910, partial [Pirellulaceae bacterium]|nr:hypothetical protein [Pirellulaceae bacterium]
MEIKTAVLAVIDALEAEQIPYMLVGSFSSNFYGIPRSTEDGDLVIELGGRSLANLRHRLLAPFQFDPQLTFENATGTHKNVVSVKGSTSKVELFRLSSEPHDQERFRRRVPVRYLDRQVILPTAEDVVITKLNWLKLLNRIKDREDVRNVV